MIRVAAGLLLLFVDSSGFVRTRVDLLKLIDPEKDAVAGKWVLKDGVLHAPALQFGRLQVPYSPPEEYDLKAVVERKGGAGSVSLGLVGGGAQLLAILDGGESSGLELVDRKTFYDNETSHKGKVLQNDRRISITCSVRKARVAVWVDGLKVVDWKADYSRVSIWPSWRVPNRKALFLGTWTSVYQLHALELTPLSRGGEKLR